MSVTTDPKPRLKTLQSNFHAQCLLCGADHPQGLKLVFSTHPDGHVAASFPCDQIYQGYTGYLHGGVIAALLDSAMTNCLFANGKAALTGELNVRFLKPVVVSHPALVCARLVNSLPPLFYMEASLCQHERLMAKSTAKFMEACGTGVSLSDRNREHNYNERHLASLH